jgi:hypothetical protein
MFQRAAEHLRRLGSEGPWDIYDPCCGSAYSLATICFNHAEYISSVRGSDIKQNLVEIGGKNLGMLNLHGLDSRIRELKDYVERWGKPSHHAALECADRLLETVRLRGSYIVGVTFQWDICQGAPPLSAPKPQLIIVDVPYGKTPSEAPPFDIGNMCKNLLPVLAEPAVVAVGTLKKQSASIDGYIRRETWKIGHRRILFLSTA